MEVASLGVALWDVILPIVWGKKGRRVFLSEREGLGEHTSARTVGSSMEAFTIPRALKARLCVRAVI